MEIKQHSENTKGAFYIEEDNELLAEMTYVLSGSDKMIIEHTEVNNKLAGKGIGKQLVAKGVDFARAHNLKIIPYCSFAKALFEKIPEFRDVLFKN